MTYTSASVLTGWQTMVLETGELIGPVFKTTTALWQWQMENIY